MPPVWRTAVTPQSLCWTSCTIAGGPPDEGAVPLSCHHQVRDPSHGTCRSMLAGYGWGGVRALVGPSRGSALDDAGAKLPERECPVVGGAPDALQRSLRSVWPGRVLESLWSRRVAGRVVRRRASPVGAADYGAERRSSTVPAMPPAATGMARQKTSSQSSQQLARNVNKAPAQTWCGGETPRPRDRAGQPAHG